MRPPIPKLKFFLANDALIHFFKNRYWSADELTFARSFCQIHNSTNIWNLKLRLLCEENNDMIVASVLADSSSEILSFLIDRYRRNLSFVQISHKLHVHKNGLQRWRDKILSDIASLIEYKLPLADIFSRNKVEALIFSLERTISFYEQYGKGDLSFLNQLKRKLSDFQDLLFVLKQFSLSSSDKLACRVIRTKILNPNLSLEELEEICHCSHTAVSHYVKDFQLQYARKFLQ